jgi:hypothetical protein
MTHAMILSISDLNTTINHEPRIRDLRLAERLGYEQPRDIRKLITRNEKELKNYGEISVTSEAPRHGGASTNVFYLNEGQLLLLCMFSETEAAAEVRKEIIDLFMAARRQDLPPPPRPSIIEDVEACKTMMRALSHLHMAKHHLAAAEAAEPGIISRHTENYLIQATYDLIRIEKNVETLKRSRSKSLTNSPNKKFD